MSNDILYYDGNCTLCSYESEQLRGRCGANLELQDIHTLPQDPTLPPRKILLERLHLRREGEPMLVGLDANIGAWQHTRIGGLWRLLRLPVVYPIANFIYNRWARWRYERLCRDSRPVAPDPHATE